MSSVLFSSLPAVATITNNSTASSSNNLAVTTTASTTTACVTTASTSTAVIVRRQKDSGMSGSSKQQETASGVKKSDGEVSLLSPQAGSKERYYFPSGVGSQAGKPDDAKVITDLVKLSKNAVPSSAAQEPPTVISTPAASSSFVKLPQVPQNPHLVYPINSSLSVSKITLPKKSDSAVVTTGSDSSATTASILVAKQVILNQQQLPGKQAVKPTALTAGVKAANPEEAAEMEKKNKLDAICKEISLQSSMQLAPPGTIVVLDKKPALQNAPTAMVSYFDSILYPLSDREIGTATLELQLQDMFSLFGTLFYQCEPCLKIG